MKEELKRDKLKNNYNPVKSLEVVRESFRRKPIRNKLRIEGSNDQSDQKITHQVSRGFSHLEAHICPRHRTVSVRAEKQGK